MTTPVHCLEGLLVPRVDEQQMRWLTEWIPKLQLLLPCLCGTGAAKHTVVMDRLNSAPRPVQVLSLFQPKTATIEDIAIALVKMFEIAAWRTTRDI